MSIYAPGTGPIGRGRTTPDHLLTPQAQGVADEPIKLLPAWTPCAVCGQAAPTPNATNGRVRIELAKDASPAFSDLRMSTLVLTRCDACEQLHRQARDIVKAHPGLAGQRGPDQAVEEVETVLVVLTVLGQPLIVPEVSTADLGLHLRHLGRAGSSVTWHGRAAADRCNPYPFAHMRLGERRRLRAALAGLLRERVALTAPPVRIPPPDLPGHVTPPSWARGCLFCGLGHLTLPAAQVQRYGGRLAAARALWTPVLTDAGSLGGRPSPERVDGYLCSRCSGAVEEEGAVGPSSLSRALLAAWAASDQVTTREGADRLQRQVDLDLRPIGWGAIAARDQSLQPNFGPWEHISPG